MILIFRNGLKLKNFMYDDLYPIWTCKFNFLKWGFLYYNNYSQKNCFWGDVTPLHPSRRAPVSFPVLISPPSSGEYREGIRKKNQWQSFDNFLDSCKWQHWNTPLHPLARPLYHSKFCFRPIYCRIQRGNKKKHHCQSFDNFLKFSILRVFASGNTEYNMKTGPCWKKKLYLQGTWVKT